MTLLRIVQGHQTEFVSYYPPQMYVTTILNLKNLERLIEGKPPLPIYQPFTYRATYQVRPPLYSTIKLPTYNPNTSIISNPIYIQLMESKGTGALGAAAMAFQASWWLHTKTSIQAISTGQSTARKVQAARRVYSLPLKPFSALRGYLVFKLPKGIWPSDVCPIEILRMGKFVEFVTEEKKEEYLRKSGKGDIHYYLIPNTIFGSQKFERPDPSMMPKHPMIMQGR